MDHKNQKVATGAGWGLLVLKGLGEYEQKLWRAEEKLGYKALSVPQQQHLAVMKLDAEIRNGGLSQYFLNSSGNQWKDAEAGLKEMGAQTQLKVLQQATRHFGSDGPSTDRGVRNDQLAKLMRANDELFDPLDDQYYDAKVSIDVIVKKFVLKNPEVFK